MIAIIVSQATPPAAQIYFLNQIQSVLASVKPWSAYANCNQRYLCLQNIGKKSCFPRLYRHCSR